MAGQASGSQLGVDFGSRLLGLPQGIVVLPHFVARTGYLAVPLLRFTQDCPCKVRLVGAVRRNSC